MLYILTALTLIWTSVLGTYLLATMNQNLSEDEAAVKSEVVLIISTWYVFQVQWCAGRFYYFWRVSWATSPVLLSCWGQRCQLGVTSGSSDQEMHLCDCPWLLQPVGPKHQPPNCLVNSPVGCTKIRGTARGNTSSTLGGNTCIKREQLSGKRKCGWSLFSQLLLPLQVHYSFLMFFQTNSRWRGPHNFSASGQQIEPTT